MIRKLKVKVCGMRDAANIRAVEALDIDMMGFIFWPGSKRHVTTRPDYLPTKCCRVGVFVDEDMEQVIRTAADYALDIIQLHGSESPEYARQLSALHPQSSIIKAFNIATADDMEQSRAYEGIADYFLFDTKGKSAGGNGKKFDWSILSDYDGDVPFIISGGIGPDDAPAIRTLSELNGFPAGKCIGIDINSRFETKPGMKDITAIKRFTNEINRNLP